MSVEGLDVGLALPVFDSAFAAVEGTEPRHTNFTANFKSCIDYIFVEAAAQPSNNIGGGGDAGWAAGAVALEAVGASSLSSSSLSSSSSSSSSSSLSWLQPVAAERSPHFELEQIFRGTPQRSLPSDRFPSDHLPVVVTMEAIA